MFDDDIREFLRFTARPIGTPENERATRFLAEHAAARGFEVTRLPFDCLRWEHGTAWIERGDTRFALHPGEFSSSFEGGAAIAQAQSLDELRALDCTGKILLLHGTIAAEPLMPQEFPFYFPDEHRALYEALEAAQPVAIVAFTGAHPSCGQNPFALITDPTFAIPMAFADVRTFEALDALDGDALLKIDSRCLPATGEQLVFRRPAKSEPSRGKLVLCAHMDTAYGTPGALDNATGIGVLLSVLARLEHWQGSVELEVLPFNGEDAYGANGQLAWLATQRPDLSDVLCAMNVDAVAHRGSKVAISSYGLSDEQTRALDRAMAGKRALTKGEPWFAGDHAIFAFRGIPSLALTSSDLVEGVMPLMHTRHDTPDQVDVDLIERAADFLATWIQGF
ncbi:MAG: M28 family peptidase [Myxococcales bacterium]|jgi:aminopeptidase YwaD|nr:M28 family peptidase [Myxococcales bacterium]